MNIREYQAQTAAAVNAASETFRQAKYKGIGDVAQAQAALDVAVAANQKAVKLLNAENAAQHATVAARSYADQAADFEHFLADNDGPRGYGW